MERGSKHEVINRARELRRRQTPIEARLWKTLRDGQLLGYKFRRQHPLGPYVADFCCVETRLIVEIDGDSHVEQQEYDENRTAYLTDMGYIVMRVTNREVLNSMDGVLEVILELCKKRR